MMKGKLEIEEEWQKRTKQKDVKVSSESKNEEGKKGMKHNTILKAKNGRM